jgi:signal transduction histidine kinase
MTDPRDAVHGQTQPPPLIQLIDVTADNQNIGLGTSTKIEPGPRHIQFRYSGIHLSAPERVRYEYKLEGLDRDWIPAATRREVNYTGLPHGQYRFLARALVPGLAVSETSLDFEVLPHFYERSSFLWFCAAAFLAGAYGVYQLHLRQIRKRFALVLQERARIAREIHDTLVQGFVGISAQLAVAIKLSEHDDPARRRIAMARKMARHSMTEAKRSMMDLRTSALEDGDLPSALSAAARRWTADKSTSLEVDVSGIHRRLDPDVEQNVLRIAQEAVTNAINHAAAGKIWVRLQFGTGTLLLTIRDDGRGFDPSTVLSLVDGHFGLQGMRERAERLGGQVDVISEPGGGTQISVNFPVPTESSHKARRRRFLERMRTLLNPERT